MNLTKIMTPEEREDRFKVLSDYIDYVIELAHAKHSKIAKNHNEFRDWGITQQRRREDGKGMFFGPKDWAPIHNWRFPKPKTFDEYYEPRASVQTKQAWIIECQKKEEEHYGKMNEYFEKRMSILTGLIEKTY